MIKVEQNQLYLSRLRLNPHNRTVWQSMKNSQRMHALLLQAFPNGNRSDHNMLYRLDPIKDVREEGVFVIVQSTMEPDWAYLRKMGILEHESEFFGDGLVKNISSLPERLQADDIFRFRLRANPTKRVPWNIWAAENPDKAASYENGSRRFTAPRVPVTLLSREELTLPDDQRPSAEDKLRDWIKRKGALHGFVVARVEALPDPLVGDMQLGSKRVGDDHMIKLAHKAIVYEGLLKITDVQEFRQALISGIGGAKAYGFGMLSLAPAGGA